MALSFHNQRFPPKKPIAAIRSVCVICVHVYAYGRKTVRAFCFFLSIALCLGVGVGWGGGAC